MGYNVDMPQDIFAHRDLIDSLKLELVGGRFSDLKKVESLADEVETTFLNQYGVFVSNQIPRITNRLLVVDQEGINDFMQNYTSTPINNTIPRAGFSRNGGFIVFDNTANCWDRMNDDYKLEAELTMEWPEKDKPHYLKHDFDLHDLAHEIAHLYQDQTNLQIIRESGAYYYQREIGRLLLKPVMGKNTFHIYRARFFEQLVKEKGDDIHKLFFGTPGLNPETKKELITRFNDPEIVRLFPHRQIQKVG